MGNATSSGNGVNPHPKPAVSSDDVGDDGLAAGDSGGGGLFRLPLYRGERDAFLPIDGRRHHCTEEGSPPLLSVDPRLINSNKNIIGGQQPLIINPLALVSGNKNNDDQRLFSPVSGAAERRQDSPHEGGVSSPPSIISSSDSSYATCYSSLSSHSPSPPNRVSIAVAGGNGDSDERFSKSCGQLGWLYSTYQAYQENHSSRISGSVFQNDDQEKQQQQRLLLPVPLPKPVQKRNARSNNLSNGGRMFDCVRPPAIQQPVASEMMSRRSNSSTRSLTSLFEVCIRSDDDGNEYIDEDYGSDQGSYYSASFNYQRSCSAASTGSNASSYSRNSDHLANAASKASLVSAFSYTSLKTQVSYYTDEEKTMPDGDEPTPESDLTRVRNYHVVTTAALPWMTGTAVNPLLRAAHLLRRNGELRKKRSEEDKSAYNDEVGSTAHIGSCTKGERSESSTWAKAPRLQIRKDMNRREDQQHDHEIERSINIDAGTERKYSTKGSKLGSEQRPLEIEKFDSTELLSTTTASNENGVEPPPSPYSLDYSCFSFSDLKAESPENSSKIIDSVVSPLGDDEESLVLSPFTSCEPMSTAMSAAELCARAPPLPEDGVRVVPSKKNQVSQLKQGQVTLVVPWLQHASDRYMLYGSATSVVNSYEDGFVGEENSTVPMFTDQREQEDYIRSWLAQEAGMSDEARELNILFYPARYHELYNSIFALGDICGLIPDDNADVCILEEPEHLNWYRAPGCSSWRDKFCHCVGVIHTNYKTYARDHAPAGFLAAPLLAGVNSFVVQANCHRVVKLSGVLQEFTRLSECTENVHGIREVYLEEGRKRRMLTTDLSSTERRKAYFIGKLLWAKGFDKLLELQACFRECTGEYFEIDIFGAGPDEREIKRAFFGDHGDVGGILNSFNKWSGGGTTWQNCLPTNFMGKLDHSALVGDAYAIFINPSLTEVLCTTTAEAIAMGKWAIIPSHPSNAFFVQFPNCLQYRNRREFVSKFRHALNNGPPHLSDELTHLLSWQAATTRCVSAAAISKRDAARKERISREKEEKTLKQTLSGLWSESKQDIQAMNVPFVSPSSSSKAIGSDAMGYGNISPITP